MMNRTAPTRALAVRTGATFPIGIDFGAYLADAHRLNRRLPARGDAEQPARGEGHCSRADRNRPPGRALLPAGSRHSPRARSRVGGRAGAGGDSVTELGPLETLTPERIIAAFVTEAERLTARLSSGELVLGPGDAVDLVFRIHLLVVPRTDSESDPAA